MKDKNRKLTTPNTFIKILTSIHLLFFFGLILFTALAFIQRKGTVINLSDTDNLFFFIVPTFAISSLFVGNFLFEKLRVDLQKKDTLEEKLTAYLMASIIKYASIEGPALLGIAAYLQNGNLIYLVLTMVLTAYFFLQMPSRDKIESDLKRRGELKNQFQNGNQIIE